MEPIIPPHGDYQILESYQNSLIVFDATFDFCARFLKKGDRTVDQMVQAARSGKQNIVEGCMASRISTETEIKLTGVARASLEELLEDYRDYLRTHGLVLWKKNDKRALAVRRLARRKDRTYELYRAYIEGAGNNAEVFCNVMVSLIHQTNFLLDRKLKSLEKSFVQDGGLRERMYRARVNARNAQPQPDTKRALAVLRGLYRDIRDAALDEDAKAELLRKVESVADLLKGSAGSGNVKSHTPEVKP
jgi:four helix bundle suffix protein